MDSDYLERHFKKCLPEGLVSMFERRPADPITYLAHWLYRYNAKRLDDPAEAEQTDKLRSTPSQVETQETYKPDSPPLQDQQKEAHRQHASEIDDNVASNESAVTGE